ncbi:uncharacterized protein BJ171DRAFT_603815 [Polychytrium aggregatum]|uniref:uncharacterized protein n=1 Tax=Polychytrium aggregatum TaxID=110093 RepID=UPI0022FF2AD4|nr:uncharacterized protein BJ171DRAFT_603815 [Polychytrium aggregatum]KAI9193356.1 hypothetical protein BJ171DRAFT_603815 [Polychytrium aggregatum]
MRLSPALNIHACVQARPSLLWILERLNGSDKNPGQAPRSKDIQDEGVLGQYYLGFSASHEARKCLADARGTDIGSLPAILQKPVLHAMLLGDVKVQARIFDYSDRSSPRSKSTRPKKRKYDDEKADVVLGHAARPEEHMPSKLPSCRNPSNLLSDPIQFSARGQLADFFFLRGEPIDPDAVDPKLLAVVSSSSLPLFDHRPLDVRHVFFASSSVLLRPELTRCLDEEMNIEVVARDFDYADAAQCSEDISGADLAQLLSKWHVGRGFDRSRGRGPFVAAPIAQGISRISLLASLMHPLGVRIEFKYSHSHRETAQWVRLIGDQCAHDCEQGADVRRSAWSCAETWSARPWIRRNETPQERFLCSLGMFNCFNAQLALLLYTPQQLLSMNFDDLERFYRVARQPLL